MGIKKVAYEKYKETWIRERNYTSEFLEKIHNQYEKEKHEDTYSFEDYINEYGYEGECYACFEEFLNTEYLEQEYMRELLSGKEYEMYCEDRKFF